MKRTIDRVDLPFGDITNLPPRKCRKTEEGRVSVHPAFCVVKPGSGRRSCKRKRPVEGSEDDDLLLLRPPLKRFCLDLSIPITIHDISPYLLADILASISALKRPVLRRVCRSWDSVLTQKTMTKNKICVVESGKKYHQCQGEEEWNVSLRRFTQHMDDIRRVVTPSTKTLIVIFPSTKDPKQRYWLGPRLLDHVRSMMASPRVVMVNAAAQDHAFLPVHEEDWDRPLDLQLINFSLLIDSIHPQCYEDLPVVLIDKLSLYLPGSLHGNSQAVLKELDRMVWPFTGPFQEARQLEWVVRYSSQLGYSYRITPYLTRRRLELGVPLEHPDVSCEDRIRSADHHALCVIACHMLVEARKGKIPPPPILFPGA